MASIVFTDTDGTWRLWNGKPWPASRFKSWTTESRPFGQSAARQSDGAVTMFRLRDDFGVTFEIPLIESVRGSSAAVRSEELDHASWTKTNATITPNVARSPGGDVTGDKLEETVANALHSASQGIAGLTDNAIYAFSSHLLRVERSWAFLRLQGKDAALHFAYINLTTGALGSTSGTLAGSGVSVWHGSTGAWVRAWIAANIASGGTTPTILIAPATGDGVSSYAGSAGQGIYAWGHQINGGATPLPYIYTQAAARTASGLEIADRLRYHLLNGGQCAVWTNDIAGSGYTTCGLKPGTDPQITLIDRRTMEFALTLQLINVAGSPARMLAHYAEQ